ncbi:hypothetical protein CMUS01_08333 [Colletotrichum musicola]|uniref:Uncharacterized protein n=1 Tax=Colletotrichum musicola TaxID=2175873 RepID=A0A8H6KCW9_9PEZI|nr:hypothetical protein CMUS01_08333 [Colletotrichum musicola]
MVLLAARQRVLTPSLLRQSIARPLAPAVSAVSARRQISDKPGLESTDVRDAADARKTNPPQPKILNAQVPGKGMKLTEEQKREVDEHNKEFEKKHDRAHQAGDDKVDKKFWQSGKEGGAAQ